MNKDQPYYKILDHTADLGIQVFGKGINALFENAALALTDIMVLGRTMGPAENITLALEAQDLDDLMVAWLGEVLYLFSAKNKILNTVHIQDVSGTRLEAVLGMAPFNPTCHEILCEIKAVTYHRITVRENKGHWEARIILDL